MFNQNILNLSFFLMFLLFSATSCGEVNQKSSEQPGRSGEEPPSGQSSQSELLVKLIAHRGGIVNENGIENSRAAMEEAIRRGYWMLEIDLRKTKDGRIILHHDSNFERYYDEPRSVSELTWEEIQELRSEVGGSRPLLFEEAAELASGRIRFMLDIKGGDFEESDYMEIESVLEQYGLLNSAFVLSDAGAQQYLHGKASIARGLDDLLEAKERGEEVSELYHLFELGGNLDQEMVQVAEELGVKVVAAINTFRYVRSGETEEERWEAAKNDVERLLDLGVEYYQVDSVYEPLFREGEVSGL